MKENEKPIAEVLRQNSRAFAIFISCAGFVLSLVLFALLRSLIQRP